MDGRPWHEVTSGTVTGWVHGRYVTESWTPQEVDALWDWETAVDRFATALGGGGELRAAVSWRGFYAVTADGVLHWWKPDRLPDPPTTNQTACEAAGGTWTAAAATCEGDTFAGLVAAPFLDAYRSAARQYTIGGRRSAAWTPPSVTAVSTAFVNFPWVAMHDQGDDPRGDGPVGSTWFIFLELDGTLPRVVGLQHLS